MDGEAYGVVLGAFLGFVSGVLLTYLSTWLQSRSEERKLKAQLLHQDRRNALAELYQIVEAEYNSYDKFAHEVEVFPRGFQATFLPLSARGQNSLPFC